MQNLQNVQNPSEINKIHPKQLKRLDWHQSHVKTVITATESLRNHKGGAKTYKTTWKLISITLESWKLHQTHNTITKVEEIVLKLRARYSNDLTVMKINQTNVKLMTTAQHQPWNHEDYIAIVMRSRKSHHNYSKAVKISSRSHRNHGDTIKTIFWNHEDSLKSMSHSWNYVNFILQASNYHRNRIKTMPITSKPLWSYENVETIFNTGANCIKPFFYHLSKSWWKHEV